jgi:cytochrome c
MNLEFNKIVASILLAGLVAMLAGTAAKFLYAGSEAHAEAHEEKRGYKVEVAEETAAGGAAAAAVEVDMGTLLAAADAKAGEAVAKKCVACHSFDKGGANKVGPNLYDIVGAKKGHIEGFQYSKALLDLQAKGAKWNYEELWAFLNAPAKYMPGTKMAFAGIKNPEERANLLAYLRSLSASPVAFPAPEKK